MDPVETPSPKKQKKPENRRWHRIRTTARWCRVATLLLVLTAVIFGVFLNKVGLPVWVEKRIQAQLRSKGWDMSFSRLRVRWHRGIVADHLQLHRTGATNGPHVFVRTAELPLNWRALTSFRLEPRFSVLRQGLLVWPLGGTNKPQRTFVLKNISGKLIFKPHDVWELNYLEGDLLGAHVRFQGELTNATQIGRWAMSPSLKAKQTGASSFWHRLLTEVESMRFDGQPSLTVTFTGDTLDLRTMGGTVKLLSAGVDSKWGRGTNFMVIGNLTPSSQAGEGAELHVRLKADEAVSPWAEANQVELTLDAGRWLTPLGPTNARVQIELTDVGTGTVEADRLLIELRSHRTITNLDVHRTDIDLTADGLIVDGLEAKQVEMRGSAQHASTNILPATLDTAWTLKETITPWSSSRWARVSVQASLPGWDQLRLADTNVSWGERVADCFATVTATISNTTTRVIALDHTVLQARWTFPELEVEVASDLDKDTGHLLASVNSEERELNFRVRTPLDPRRFSTFVGTNVQARLSDLVIPLPPQFSAEGTVDLPGAGETKDEWGKNVASKLSASGLLLTGPGRFRGVSFRSLRLPFTVTNLNWAIEDLKLERSEGVVLISGSADHKAGDFAATVDSGINLVSLKPGFRGLRQEKIFDLFEIKDPQQVYAKFRGNWKDLDRLSANGHVTLTNAKFRGQSTRAVNARLIYTNRFLSIVSPRVDRGGESGRADGIGIDLKAKRFYLTNATGNITPHVVTRSVGPKTYEITAPYVFDVSPDSKASGSFSLVSGDHTSDMRFEVDGGPFHWQQFHLEKVKATMLWWNESLVITNVQGIWHDAEVTGWAAFDFTPEEGAHFTFYVDAEGGDLRAILGGLDPDPERKVEGTVTGDLMVTSAKSYDWTSWQGYGSVQLTNGFLWDIPLFGVFSPVLNTVLPGLGNSRARHASASYRITNSVIVTEDMEVQSIAMRMNYAGRVDFDQRVEGTMEAELGRNIPGLGYVISRVFWPVTKLFEYKITGTLEEPKTEALYIFSRVLLMPLTPLKTLKELVVEPAAKERDTPPQPGPLAE